MLLKCGILPLSGTVSIMIYLYNVTRNAVAASNKMIYISISPV